MKIKLLIFTLFIIFNVFLLSFAHANEIDEIIVNKMYNNIRQFLIPSDNDYENGTTFTKVDLAMDYAVEILKKFPCSCEAYSTLAHFRNGVSYSYGNALNKYLAMKKKYINSLDDLETDIAEKLLFMAILQRSNPGTSSLSSETLKKEHDIAVTGLIKMKDECQNKDYAALATKILFYEKGLDYEYEFLKKFPNHPAIPFVKLAIATSSICVEKDYDKGIDEINKLLEKYSNFMTPDGWKFEIACYEILVLAYAWKKEPENAKKYFDIINQTVPDYPNLSSIANQIESNTKDNNVQDAVERLKKKLNND